MVWVESSPGQIYREGSASPPRPGSACPQTWEENFDRSQMSTEVLINRGSPSNVPALRYIFPSNTGTLPPDSGEFFLDANQENASKIYISRTDDLGVDATVWLDYLHDGCSLTFTALLTKEARGYAVTGDPIQRPNYFEVPIFWTSGETPVPHGPVDLTFSITPEVPQNWQDTFGVNHYGRIPFSRTDLINVNRDLFQELAGRILDVRGSGSVPRVESVTLDARTGPGMRIMNLISATDPGKPSRYRMTLNVDGRRVFDRMCFATGVRHFIASDEWTTRITLDIAEWAAQL